MCDAHSIIFSAKETELNDALTIFFLVFWLIVRAGLVLLDLAMLCARICPYATIDIQ
jgi:hypothetical protein